MDWSIYRKLSQNYSLKKIKTSDYQIFMGDAAEALKKWLKKNQYASHFALVDENVYRLHKKLIDNWCREFSIKKKILPVSEKLKSIRSCEKIWTWLMESGADRHSLLINIGGGIIGDMGGFAAATYKRGIAFIQMPTTLLSQVDASIGGKLAVNFKSIKNNVGVFRDPETIIIDIDFLKTLSDRELASGYAEVIKHALIADKNLWKKLLEIDNLRAVNWNKLLTQAIEVKNNIVAIDPFEKKERKALNFGHTVGHALESIFLKTKKPLLHGEAVAIGMICESFLSYQIGTLSKKELLIITKYINRFYKKRNITLKQIKKAHELVKHDKKNKGKVINYTFLKSIGKFEIDRTANQSYLAKSISYYLQSL